MASFGEKVRKLRRDRDVTQKELAEYLGVQGPSIFKYESERDSYPNVKTLIKLADYFNVSIDYLLRDEQPIQNNISANNSFIQSNIQANNGGIVVNGQSYSPEISELIHIYEGLQGRDRFKLINFAVELRMKSESDK